jgi:hypothetical protein
MRENCRAHQALMVSSLKIAKHKLDSGDKLSYHIGNDLTTLISAMNIYLLFRNSDLLPTSPLVKEAPILGELILRMFKILSITDDGDYSEGHLMLILTIAGIQFYTKNRHRLVPS